MIKLKKYDTSSAKRILKADFNSNIAIKSPFTIINSADLSLAASWNTESILLALSSKEAKKYVIHCGKFNKTLDVTNTVTEICVSAKELGTEICNVDQLIPFTVETYSASGSPVFDGFIQLCDRDTVFVLSDKDMSSLEENQSFSAALNPERTQKDTDAAIKARDGILHIYDRYDDNGNNLNFVAVSSEINDIAAFESHGEDWLISMDIKINSFPCMDYTTVCNAQNAYGVSFVLTTSTDNSNFYFGIQRNQKGLLYLFINRPMGLMPQVITDVAIGDAFNLTAKWCKDNMIALFINGKCVAYHRAQTVDRPMFKRNSLRVKWNRSRYIPQSHEDDLDIEISNFSVSLDHSVRQAYDYPPEAIFSTEPKLIEGTDIYIAPDSLILNKTLRNAKYKTETKLIFSSSDTSILSNDGIFTPKKDASSLVNMTVTGAHGEYEAFSRTYKFFVPASDIKPDERVLTCVSDKDPFVSEAVASSEPINLSVAFNSIVYDMGSVSPINRVILKTVSESMGLINRNYISLYVSDDNRSYTYVKDFSLLRLRRELYIYNFDVKARYIKIHTTPNGLGDTGNILGLPCEIIRAEYSSSPLLSDGSFKGEATVSLTNGSKEAVSDRIFSLTPADMGISICDLNPDMSDVRFILDGKFLPHYLSDGIFNVRVFEMDGGKTVKVRVLYGNESARSVSDGHETFEIQYGTKHARRNCERGWFNSVATMPNGDLLRIVTLGTPEGKVALAKYRSTNGGLTWSDVEFIPNSDMIRECGGFIVDEKNCKVFFFAYDLKISGISPEDKYCKYYIFESNDNGYTWSSPVSPTGNNVSAPAWAISYSNGITLSCEDGAGPNVDYVFTTGAMRNTATDAFCTTAIYSRDGGKSWIFSDSRVEYTHGSSDFHEGGLSEETVLEKEDGTLIFYARCQIADVPHFAKSYSFDHGVTWSQITDDTLSNIYTSNTQPIIERLNGTPVFLWGGNNSMGGTTYLRYPLNLAYSEDDGETFKGIIDTSLQTIVATFSRDDGRGLHTNPDITFCKYRDVDMAYIVSTRHQMYIQDTERYIYKTKGAFDSFENGVSPEGWLSVNNNPIKTTSLGASDGELAMRITPEDTVVRPLHYMESGKVSLDLYAEAFGEGFAIELQSAFNDGLCTTTPMVDGSVKTDRTTTTPICLSVDADGNLLLGNGTKIKLHQRQNSLSVDFDGNAKTASLTVNGNSFDIPYLSSESYVGFAVIFTKKDAVIDIDKFIAIKTV